MEHTEAVLKLCRVCGENISRFRVSYSCLDKKEDLNRAFSINIDEDRDDIHPRRFCDGCYAVIKRKIKATEDNRPYLESIQPFQWSEHDGIDCATCNKLNTVKKGGRPKKQRKNRGKPIENSCHDIIKFTLDIAPPTFYDSKANFQLNIPPSSNIQHSDLHCCTCFNVLNSPVQLSCSSFICSSCLTKWIELSQSNKCPVCYCHSLTTSEIKNLQPIHFRLLQDTIVKCTDCAQSVKLSDMKSHNCCTTSSTTSSSDPTELTATDILRQPITSPPTNIEKKVASNLMKRMMHDGHITITTGGQVSTQTQV